MTPEQLAKSDTEAAHQTALFAWAALNAARCPQLNWLFHVPNGGTRGDTAQSRAIAGGQLKAQGVRKGVADIFLPVGRFGKQGLFIEMKAPSKESAKNGGLSVDQIEFALFVEAQNYKFEVCYNWRQAVCVLENYLGVLK